MIELLCLGIALLILGVPLFIIIGGLSRIAMSWKFGKER